MSNPKNEPTQPTVLPLAEPVKKPYEKPAIVYRAPLEAVASDCTGLSGGKGDGTCGNLYS